MSHAQSLTDANKKVDGEWISYRDAYKAMVLFEKYGKSKHLIQNRFQIIAKDKAFNFENLRLSLNGQSSVMSLSLDVLGQTQLPLLKAAYDENAELYLHPKIGQFSYRSRVSIQVRADGNYDYADLKLACEQTLNYLSSVDPSSVAGKKCSGIKFGFDKRETNAGVEVRSNNQTISSLPITDNGVIWADSNINLKVAQFHFNSANDKVHLLTRIAPTVIVAVIE